MKMDEIIRMMQSDDYIERFKSEYELLKLRMERLERTIHIYDYLFMSHKPPKELLLIQLQSLQTYMMLLEYRAKVENIIL